MRNYIIWESENDNDKIIQIFNKYDLPSIQEHFTKQGYFIKETFIGKGGNYFFVIGELEYNGQ